MQKHRIVFFLFIAATRLFAQDNSTSVTGSVTDANQQPLPNVHVIIKETDQGTYTDAYGEYTILAKPGDILLFSYIGMQTAEVRVERSPSVINVKMQAVSIELEELEVKTRRRYKTQQDLLEEYPTNKNLIKTAWGIIDRDRTSINMRIIDGERLIPVGIDFLNSIQGQYPQMYINRDDSRGTVVHFQRSESPVMFDVDGVIYASNPPFLSVNEIERVAILDQNAAIFKYGQQGVGGVIVVNTKTQTWMDDMGVKRRYDNQTLVDSLTREVNHLEVYRPYEPSPIGKLHEAKTKEQARAIYAGEKKSIAKILIIFLKRMIISHLIGETRNRQTSCFNKSPKVLKMMSLFLKP